MKLTRIVSLLFALAIAGMMMGGAAATAAVHPIPIPPPTVPYVVYTIPPPTPGHPELFVPFVAATMGVGLVEIRLINYDPWPAVYQLRGTTVTVLVLPEVSVTILATMSHPGSFPWVSLLPTPGSPPSETVGILDVDVSP